MNKLGAVLCLTLASASGLAAQTTLKLTGAGSITSGGVYVGDYTAIMNGPGAIDPGVPITINCVDFFHEVTLGQTWDVSEINLATGNFSGTYYGSQANYQQAAYLTTIYSNFYRNPVNDNEIAGIQHAIWNIVDGGGFNGHPFTQFTDEESAEWTQCATGAAATPGQAGACSVDGVDYAAFNSVNYADFVLLHPTAGSAQEMLTTTPEPSSMALLGMGLFGLVPIVRRKRK